MRQADTDGGRASDATAVRDVILATASELFYREGARAVGVDLIVQRAGVAKTSLYRHFRSKDELIAAYLQREDEDFWRHWDSAAARHPDDPEGELAAQLTWLGERLARPGHRGCPQLTVAAEFADRDHPARAVATAHKNELRRRLTGIATRMAVARPAELADQLWLMIDGALMNASLLAGSDPARRLLSMARALVTAARDMPGA